MFHPRFDGNSGVVTGQQGDCYTVEINDKGKDKTIIAHPVHLTTV
jgi:large subunit ribosomal protein L21e